MHDVVIAGAGVIGLSLAYDLAGHGLSVRVLERGQPGREASWAGAGILPPAKRRDDAHPEEQLAALSCELHPRWAADLREETGVDTGFRRSGGIYLAGTQADPALLDRIELWKLQGVRIEPLDTPSLGGREPGLRIPHAPANDRQPAAYLVPEECQLRNPRHVKALLSACIRRGVDVSPGMLVDDFQVQNDRVTALVASGEVVPAKLVCITAGCWTAALAARLGVQPAIRPIRGQIALLFCPTPPLRHILNRGSRYLVPRTDGRVLAGSTEEDAGFDARTTAGGIAGLLEFAIDLCPDLAAAQLERSWAGLRPRPLDGRPYLGRAGQWDNVYLAAGHFRSGLQLSPGTAVVMSELIRGETPSIDLAPFRLDRGKGDR